MRFTRVALSPDPDLAIAALMIARLEYPTSTPDPTSRSSTRWAAKPRVRVAAGHARADDTPPGIDPQAYARVAALNDYLFREQRFVGNTTHYEDPRNTFLNEVLDRRTGIPITLALVYMEVARRAGIPARRHQLPGPLPRALPDAAGTGSRPDHRRLPRRRAPLGRRLPAAAAQARRRGRGLGRRALAGARHEAADPDADAGQPEARLRADVLVSAGPRHHRAAARRRSIGDARAARPRPARLSAERLFGGASRPAGVPAAVGQGRTWTRTNAASTAADSGST